MTPYSNEHLSPENRAFVARLARHFSPSPLSPNQRAAFDMELQQRLEKRRRNQVFFPAIATLATAATLIVFTLTGRFGLPPPDSLTANSTQIVSTSLPPASADEGTIDQWMYDLLALNEPLAFPQGSPESAEFDETDDNGQAELLPDEYLAIEHIFLES